MGILQLSFHGPFFYRFTPAQVEIHAAKCAGHNAALYTAKNELTLSGRHRHGHTRRYRMSGPVFTPPNPSRPTRFHDPDETILDASKAAKPALHSAYFSIVVPVPQIVVPLLPSEVEVVDNSTNPPGEPRGALIRRATGLRFFYEADLSRNLTLALDGSSSATWISDFDAPALGQDFADAEIRYSPVTPELQEHQDALDCFDQVASVAGVDWWLCFDGPSKPQGTQPFVRRGMDCKGPILITRADRT